MEESKWMPVWVLSCSRHQWYLVVAPRTCQQVAVFQNKKATQIGQDNDKKSYRALTMCQALSRTFYTEHLIELSQLCEAIIIIILVLHIRRVQ